MGLIKWILSKERIARYVAKAIPKNVIADNLNDDIIRSSGAYKVVERLRKELEARLGRTNEELGGAREVNVSYERTIGALERDKRELLTTNQSLSEQLHNKESSLVRFTEELQQAINVETELIADNKRLRGVNEAQKGEIEGSSAKAIEFEGRYHILKRDVSYHLRQTRKRAELLEERFDRELEKLGERLGEQYRKDLEAYFAASERVIEGHQTRADDAEKQQVFLRGALIRADKVMSQTLDGYVSFFYKNFGTNSSLTKVIGVILNNELKPVYATPKFLEVSGITEKELYKIEVPHLVCSLNEHKDRSKIRYRGHNGKEHMGTVYLTSILSKDGETIGTFVQIDQTSGDWLREMAHIRREKFDLINLTSGGSAGLFSNS